MLQLMNESIETIVCSILGLRDILLSYSKISIAEWTVRNYSL